MGLNTSPDSPVTVEQASRLVGDWINRLGEIWVEGQIAQLNRRNPFAYITLRDVDQAMSISLHALPATLATDGGTVSEGDRVIVRAKPTYFKNNGQLNWRAAEFRTVGVGDLLAKVEELKRLLNAEGLFAPERKRPLPFLPRTVGLITGHRGAAQKDVVENARRRWPSVMFEVREVAVQGPKCVPQVKSALIELQSTPDIDVIVIARGGGSVEDLLPFSNETLVRAAADCPIPIVSAIGHEIDTPILDLVADLRASTPTDAAKRIVPDLATETNGLATARQRLKAAMNTRLGRERHALQETLSRPVMARPDAVIVAQRERLTSAIERSRRSFAHAIQRERTALGALERHRQSVTPANRIKQDRADLALMSDRASTTLSARIRLEGEKLRSAEAALRAMSPQSTLDRGYALVRLPDGTILKDAEQVEVSTTLYTRLARGSVTSIVMAHEPSHAEAPAQPWDDPTETPPAMREGHHE